MLRRIVRSFLTDPEFPPDRPGSLAYLVLLLMATGAFILLTSFFPVRYGGFSVLSVIGIAFLVRGVAEFLPARWHAICVSLRVMGLLIAVLALWLLILAT